MSLNRLLRLLAGLLILISLVLLGQLTATALLELRRTGQALDAVEQFSLGLKLAEMASRERGPTNGLLGEPLPHSEPILRRLGEARERTDTAWAAFTASKGSPSVPAHDRDRAIDEARTALLRARETVDRVGHQAQRSSEEISRCVQEMVAVVRRLAPSINDLAIRAQTAYPPIGNDLQAARLVAELREYAGLLGSQFTAALAGQRALTRDELDAVHHSHGRIDELRFLVDLRLSDPNQLPAIRQAWASAQQRYFGKSLLLAEQVVADSDAGRPYRHDPAGFAEAYVPDMNALFDVRDVLLERTHAHARAAQRDAFWMLGAVLVGVVLMGSVLVALVTVIQKRVLRPLSAVVRAIDELADDKPLQPLPQPVVDDEMAAVIGAMRTLQERTQQRLALEKERDSLIEQLRNQSNTDALTGLLNRRGVFEAGGHLLEQARRHRFSVCAILLDVDHFKRFNDELGHAAGDAVLVDVAEVVRKEGRSSDLAGRLGGEEFVLLLSHCDVEQGKQFAERARAALECLACARLPLTASFGVAAFPQHGDSLELLLSCADKAMYGAKATGRNRVMTAV